MRVDLFLTLIVDSFVSTKASEIKRVPLLDAFIRRTILQAGKFFTDIIDTF